MAAAAGAKPAAVSQQPSSSGEGQGKEGKASQSSQQVEGALPGWLASLNAIVDNFVVQLKRREISGSQAVAIRTADVLRIVVSRSRFTTIHQLLDMVRNVGKTLAEANPQELSIGNVVRRVLYIVRQETATTLRLDAGAGAAGAAVAVGTGGKDAPKDGGKDGGKEKEGESAKDAKAAPGAGAGVVAGAAGARAHGDAKAGGSSSGGGGGGSSDAHSAVNVDLSLSLHKLLDQQSADDIDDFGSKPIVQSTAYARTRTRVRMRVSSHSAWPRKKDDSMAALSFIREPATPLNGAQRRDAALMPRHRMLTRSNDHCLLCDCCCAAPLQK
jgi:translation initiation factor 2B subunit (eIF-2B alpha/beta/delta family)